MQPIALLVGLVSFALVLLAAQGVRMVRYDAAATLSMEEFVERKVRGSLIIRIVDGLGARFSRTLRWAYNDRRRRRIAQQLRVAGHPAGLTLDSYIQRETGFIFLALIVFCFSFLLDDAVLGVAFALPLACWMRLWVINVGIRRSREIDNDLPDFLDVLAVTVRSGMSFRPAIERVSAYQEGALSEEMMNAIRSMRLGVTRRDAFIAVRDNSRSENVAIFVSAFLQAEELGTPLAEALGDISAEIRRERAQQVRRAAARAQPKIALVVTMCILPATLILIIGGVVMMNIGLGFGD